MYELYFMEEHNADSKMFYQKYGETCIAMRYQE